MKRSDLEHLLRAAGRVIGADQATHTAFDLGGGGREGRHAARGCRLSRMCRPPHIGPSA